jgi:phenylalanyl-tRNA synthetase beta chain
MKFSENWLREWVQPEADTASLVERLTMAGLEVDGVEDAAGEIRNVVVGEVLAVERHPDADKLSLCRVSDGSEEFAVVCGAPNVRAGLKVPFARVGGRLPNGMKIRRAKIRGVESSGMLCSAEELGMAEASDGLLELPGAMTVGGDIVAALALDDRSIDVDLTPNRGDCLSIAGLAREVSALFDIPVTAPPVEPVAPQTDDRVPVRLESPAGCPRYGCRVIRDVDLGAGSPLWLQERLRRCGLRSIDPVVDVTNYVMLELGQPLHAFDLDRIEGGIVVRQAGPGECLTLLDGSELELGPEHLLIADEAKALALAGIMGGEHSGVGSETRHILLESAFFAPLALAGKARGFGMHTDASHRFERGVDFTLQEKAIERATALLLEIVGGRPGPVVLVEDAARLPAVTPVTLRAERLQTMLGVDVPRTTVAAVFQRLGLNARATEAGWQVIPPPFRFDIRIEADLVEEVARVYGYERIPEQRQPARLAGRAVPEARQPLEDARRRLVALGYQEAITYSFVEPGLQRALDPDLEPVALSNPISADMAVMRTSLWPGLIATLRRNLQRQQPRVRLFESGLRFRREGGELVQQPGLAGAVAGSRWPEQWGQNEDKVDFFDIKGDVEALLLDLGGTDLFRFGAGSHPALHPGQAARVLRGEQTVGLLGRLHPRLEKVLDLDRPVFLFELEFALILERNLPKFNGLSKFPEVRRDLALVVDRDLPAARLLDAVADAAGSWLQDIKLFDMYSGQHIDANKKSLGVGLVLQHPEQTLTDNDVNALIERVVARVADEFGAVLRN